MMPGENTARIEDLDGVEAAEEIEDGGEDGGEDGASSSKKDDKGTEDKDPK